MEFLEYAYLQTGQDRKAAAVVREAETIKASELEPGFEGYYGWVEASFKVRYALETGEWTKALQLTPAPDAGPYVKRVDYWAQAVAAGHLKNKAAADAARNGYEDTFSKTELADEQAQHSAQLAETQAWAGFASGNTSEAISTIQQAADHQDKVGKGEVELPAREMLADMLRLSGDTAAALDEYKLSLKIDPGRLSCLVHADEEARNLKRFQDAALFERQINRNTLGGDRPWKARVN